MFIRYANIDIIQLIIQMSLSNNQTMYRSHFKNEYSVYSIKTIKRILKMKYLSLVLATVLNLVIADLEHEHENGLCSKFDLLKYYQFHHFGLLTPFDPVTIFQFSTVNRSICRWRTFISKWSFVGPFLRCRIICVSCLGMT